MAKAGHNGGWKGFVLGALVLVAGVSAAWGSLHTRVAANEATIKDMRDQLNTVHRLVIAMATKAGIATE